MTPGSPPADSLSARPLAPLALLVGRLAPSPTGYMHLGNAWAFWLAWLDIRSRPHARARLVLRMEDIDPARSRPEYARALREDLRWLGLDWDEESPPQSTRGKLYDRALAVLNEKGLVYPCFCTRAELRALAGAPHVDDAGASYPGTCRELTTKERAALAASGKKASLRLACPPDTPWRFHDGILGEQCFTLREVGGDFALRRSDGVYAYQLAVTVDDLTTGVNRVARGRDILSSTPRQLYLRDLLRDSFVPGAPPPSYAHFPLLLDHEGERLAKRHASLSLRSLRERGVTPESIIGYLAFRAGFLETARPIHAAEFATRLATGLAKRPAGEADAREESLIDRMAREDVSLPEDPAATLLGLSHP